MRRVAKAKAERSCAIKGRLIRFVPGGYYWLLAGKLYTGVRHNEAAPAVQERLIALAIKAARANVWVTRNS